MVVPALDHHSQRPLHGCWKLDSASPNLDHRVSGVCCGVLVVSLSRDRTDCLSQSVALSSAKALFFLQ